jgi:[CysO sulfur-carrier protein]-S-L-cysteine hydrolase
MLPFKRLELPVLLLEEVIEQARGELPNECCGLLAGSIMDGVWLASARFPIGNDESSPRQYLSNPGDMLLAFRTIRERGLELLAIYHSHPRSEPVPSQRDIERNTYGESVVHLIVGLGGPQPVVRAWWLGERDSREAEWSLTD